MAFVVAHEMVRCVQLCCIKENFCRSSPLWEPASYKIVAILNIRRLTPLDTQSIIAELEAERDRLNRAIAALEGGQRRSRPAGKTATGRKRHLSAAARKKIGEAMKKRWAERKKKAA
jgi:hypothetical protein